MRQTVVIQFAPQRTQEITLHTDQPAMAADEARRWLDAQFVAQECEPLRTSGKVLTADKVMALAQTVPASKFTDEPEWAQAYARATLAALGRPLVTVDLHANAISY
ncbi:MAG: hypothetical protein Q8K45_01560 [Rubrivivax sp.]|nr:hypothetical protein [Rubrivivax sp.]